MFVPTVGEGLDSPVTRRVFAETHRETDNPPPGG